ncbi:hypothetical protein C0Q70_18468 [Pomacea canaliculata]|uniref:Potassium channel tetramerisation-type BTB domain-containing protein n=1 Tax=Pomacea canaliculata TaxID=400727 RepID=A0A2T7NGK8_POMCA|nr:hypothetical protein C0Q70_18468 [Pomacea canaliculata]
MIIMSSPVSTRPSSSTTPNGHYHKISGVPCPATPTRYTAPVHIDVGGVIYTSSLETLTRLVTAGYTPSLSRGCLTNCNATLHTSLLLAVTCVNSLV